MGDIAIQQSPAHLVRTPRLRTDFVWTFVGNVVYSSSQWGILILLAKLGTPEHVGQYSLGVAICTPVFMFTNLQLRSIQASDVNRKCSFGDYLGFRLLATAIALGVVAAICS